jgi:hypothetical protein
MFSRLPQATTVASDALKKWIILLFSGSAAVAVGAIKYTPLDSDFVYGLDLLLFFLPTIPYLVGCFYGRLPNYLPWLRPFMTLSGTILVILALFTFLNGNLDRRSPQPISANVTRKIVDRGRGRSYRIVVESWRPDHSTETLDVRESSFGGMRVGSPVLVKVHEGRFGLPWYDPPEPIK